jgi:hypothetical protein
LLLQLIRSLVKFYESHIAIGSSDEKKKKKDTSWSYYEIVYDNIVGNALSEYFPSTK